MTPQVPSRRYTKARKHKPLHPAVTSQQEMDIVPRHGINDNGVPSCSLAPTQGSRGISGSVDVTSQQQGALAIQELLENMTVRSSPLYHPLPPSQGSTVDLEEERLY